MIQLIFKYGVVVFLHLLYTVSNNIARNNDYI